MLGGIHDLLCIPSFNNFPFRKNDYALSERLDNIQVMGNKKDRKVSFPNKAGNKVKDFRLDRQIQS